MLQKIIEISLTFYQLCGKIYSNRKLIGGVEFPLLTIKIKLGDDRDERFNDF